MKKEQSLQRQNITLIGVDQTGPHYWVGHFDNGLDYYAGQTFKPGISGKLKSIRLFPAMVVGTGEAHLDLYEFDESSHSWKDKKGESTVPVSKEAEGHWMEFRMNNILLEKNRHYGFKVSCNNGSSVAIAECPWNLKDPYTEGEEWTASSAEEEGKFHHDFDLAFIAEIESD